MHQKGDQQRAQSTLLRSEPETDNPDHLIDSEKHNVFNLGLQGETMRQLERAQRRQRVQSRCLSIEAAYNSQREPYPQMWWKGPLA